VQESDVVRLHNPLLARSVSKYLVREWSPTAASWNCGVVHICAIGGKAIMDNSNSVSEAYFKQCNRDRQMKIHSTHPGLMVKFLYNRMREDVRTWVKDHENIHGIVEMKNSNKRRKAERRMASRTQMEVAEEDKLDIEWGKCVKHTKSSALAKQLNTLLTDVKHMRTIAAQ
jgi:hypothetical protein